MTRTLADAACPGPYASDGVTVTAITSPGCAIPVSASLFASGPGFATASPLRVHAYASDTVAPSGSVPSAVAVSVAVGQFPAMSLESSTVAVGAVLASATCSGNDVLAHDRARHTSS